jgi:hypothetical protein
VLEWIFEAIFEFALEVVGRPIGRWARALFRRAPSAEPDQDSIIGLAIILAPAAGLAIYWTLR